MGKIKTIARRSFLVGSVAIAGGVAFGAYKYSTPYANPLLASEIDKDGVLNPFLIIDQRGITIITPRAEMGQGVHTTLAALVAEELDVDFKDIRTEHGPTSHAYFNEVGVEDALPFPSYEEGTVVDALRSAMKIPAKFLGLQVTGGSTTTKDAFVKMRKAGASARITLVEAAAEQWGVDVASLKTENGFVVNPAGGEKASYMSLAPKAANITAPADPQLKDPKDWRYLGKSMPRVDVVAKSTGTAEYAIDKRLAGMKFASVRINPKLGGKMIKMDASVAEKLPGVDKIIPLENGFAAVARNSWAAMRALDEVEVEWGDQPYPATTDGIIKQIEAGFDLEPNSNILADGDVVATLASATKTVSAEYRVPFLAHATMEPMSASALYKDGRIDVWTGSQAPTLVRWHLAKEFGLDEGNIGVHVTFLGGGFGRRAEIDFARQAATIAKAMEGTPINLIWSREEDMQHDFYRPAAIARFEGALDDSGTPTALKAEVSSPSVIVEFANRVLGLPASGPDKVLVDGIVHQPYSIPNYDVKGYSPDVKVPLGTWRSVGASYGGFFHESFIDELAAEGGQDPVEMRLKLLAGLPAAQGVVQAVAKLANWQGRGSGDKARGLAYTFSFGSHVAQIIDVSMTEDGIKIDKVWCAIDAGPALDPAIIKAQMQSGIVYGLSAAINGEITFDEGQIEQGNFDTYEPLRMANTPQVETVILQNGSRIGGVGEPGTPPSMPALANAVFALTGKRVRSLPLNKEVEFV